MRIEKAAFEDLPRVIAVAREPVQLDTLAKVMGEVEKRFFDQWTAGITHLNHIEVAYPEYQRYELPREWIVEGNGRAEIYSEGLVEWRPSSTWTDVGFFTLWRGRRQMYHERIEWNDRKVYIEPIRKGVHLTWYLPNLEIPL